MRIYPQGTTSTTAQLEQQFHMINRREEFFPSAPEPKAAKPPAKSCLNVFPLGAPAMPDKKPIDNI